MFVVATRYKKILTRNSNVYILKHLKNYRIIIALSPYGQIKETLYFRCDLYQPNDHCNFYIPELNREFK